MDDKDLTDNAIFLQYYGQYLEEELELELLLKALLRHSDRNFIIQMTEQFLAAARLELNADLRID